MRAEAVSVDGGARRVSRRCVIAVACGVALLLGTTAAEALPVQARVVRSNYDIAALSGLSGRLDVSAFLVTAQLETGNPRTSGTFTYGCISVVDWARLGRGGGSCVVLPRQPATQGMVAPESARMRFRVRRSRAGGWFEVDMSLTGKDPVLAGSPRCFGYSSREILGRWLPTGVSTCTGAWTGRYATVRGTLRGDRLRATTLKPVSGVMVREVMADAYAGVQPTP